MMFETDSDGNGLPCECPVTLREHFLATLHTWFDRFGWHQFTTPSMCLAYDRVVSGYPCTNCEAQRTDAYDDAFWDAIDDDSEVECL